MTDSSLANYYLPEPNHSGSSSKDYVVVHDIECPPGQGWAFSLGGPNYLQNPNEQASVHYIVDATQIVQGLSEDLWAWGAGTPGSAHGIHIEQAGYASFTRAQWLGDSSAIGSTYVRPNGVSVTYTAQDAQDMASQLQLYAKLVADIHQRHGWNTVGWMTDGELQSASQGASTTNHMTEHRQITAVLGGTVHSDPGTDYPKDILLAAVQAAMGGNPTPAPAPTPIPTPPNLLEQIMAIDRNSADYKNLVSDIAVAVLNAKINSKWNAKDPDNLISVANVLSGISLQTKSNWQRISALVSGLSKKA